MLVVLSGNKGTKIRSWTWTHSDWIAERLQSIWAAKARLPTKPRRTPHLNCRIYTSNLCLFVHYVLVEVYQMPAETVIGTDNPFKQLPVLWNKIYQKLNEAGYESNFRVW